jgi:TatD DNase family protein
VSLNAADKDSYDEICKPTFPGAFEAVLEFIQKARGVLAVEATAVRLPEVDLTAVQSLADSLGVPFRVREYISCFF